MGIEILPTQPFQISPADDLGMVNFAIQLHDVDQLGQLIEMIKDFANLNVVFGDDHLRLRVGQNKANILVLSGRIDRCRRTGRAHDRQVGQYPLHPGAGGDGHAIFRPDAEREQPSRQLECLVLGLQPTQRDPAVLLDVTKCLLRGGCFDPAYQHGAHRSRPRCKQCCLGHIRRVANPDRFAALHEPYSRAVTRKLASSAEPRRRRSSRYCPRSRRNPRHDARRLRAHDTVTKLDETR